MTRCRLLFATVLALFMVAVFIGPWRVEWIAALDGSRPSINLPVGESASVVAAGSLRVGAASRSITEAAVRHGAPLAGYVGRVGSSNNGAKDEIAVQAVTLDNGVTQVAFVTGDLLIVNKGLADDVRAAVERLDPALRNMALHFGATHTHSGPGGYPGRFVERFGMGASLPEFRRALVESMADAVVAAANSRVDAEWTSFAVESPPECIANRTRIDGEVNRWIDVLAFRAPGSNRWSSSVVSFGAHATCDPNDSKDDRRLSGDYPAALRKRLEREFGGTSAFLAGAVGSMAPGRLGVPRAELADRLADRLATTIIGAAARATWRREIELGSARFQFALPAPAVKVYRGWCLSPVLAAAILPTTTTITATRIGDAVYLGAPADFGGTIALRLRGGAPGLRTVATSFAGDYVGYVIEDEDYWLDKYEPRSMVFYGRRQGALFEQELLKASVFMTTR